MAFIQRLDATITSSSYFPLSFEDMDDLLAEMRGRNTPGA
jgi:hypothetical protein